MTYRLKNILKESIDKFPDYELRNRITKNITIGDWLRHNEKNIRNS